MHLRLYLLRPLSDLPPSPGPSDAEAGDIPCNILAPSPNITRMLNAATSTTKGLMNVGGLLLKASLERVFFLFLFFVFFFFCPLSWLLLGKTLFSYGFSVISLGFAWVFPRENNINNNNNKNTKSVQNAKMSGKPDFPEE